VGSIEQQTFNPNLFCTVLLNVLRTNEFPEQSQVFVRIFRAIDRLPQLLKYYHNCQKGILMRKWQNLVETEQDEGVSEWMHKLYDILLSTWHEQVCDLH
jgi:hypothetical protein